MKINNDNAVKEIPELIPYIKEFPPLVFWGAEIPMHWIKGFQFSRPRKSITVHLLNNGKIKNIFRDKEEANKEYMELLKQYESIMGEI